MLINKFDKQFKVKWWSGEILNSELIAIDTETSLITSPAIIPNLILTTAYDGGDSVYIIKNHSVSNFIEAHCNAKLLFFNAAFDIPVLETQDTSLDHHIRHSKLLDGQILYRLLNIALEGQEAQKWSLDHVTLQLTGQILSKDDGIRLTFGQYLQDGIVDYSSISKEHLEYACLDPIATHICTKKILAQIALLPTSTNLAHDINLVGDLALAQVTRNGVHIDQERVNLLRGQLEKDKVLNEEILATYGYLKGKKGNTKVLEDICIREQFILPVTETGKMSCTKTSLEPYRDHSFISAYLSFKGFSKQQNFLNELTKSVVHPRYNTIKVTSRTSCSKPNYQQMPRLGDVRGCFIPKPGNVLIDCDYSMIELCALADVNLKLFKYSYMADQINKGNDLHKYLASKIYNCSESEVTKEQRQFSKIGNFGFGADMGAETFVSHAAKSGYKITLDEAIEVKEGYLNAYPEMRKYFNRAKGRDTFISDTGLIRAKCSYTQFLNCAFQTKAAEGAKIALYNLTKAGYKVVIFVHDQVCIDHPKNGAEEALENIKRIMIDSMQTIIRGVKISVEGEICERFKK